MFDVARSFVFRLAEDPDHLLFSWFCDIENVSFRIMTAVIDKRPTGRAFDTTD